jgi:hypothetical protein
MEYERYPLSREPYGKLRRNYGGLRQNYGRITADYGELQCMMQCGCNPNTINCNKKQSFYGCRKVTAEFSGRKYLEAFLKTQKSRDKHFTAVKNYGGPGRLQSAYSATSIVSDCK